jgi:enoyl-[acyl-carrier protein] reductase II
MFEGDLENGELEIGQISGLINAIKPAAQLLKKWFLNLKQQRNERVCFRVLLEEIIKIPINL